MVARIDNLIAETIRESIETDSYEVYNSVIGLAKTWAISQVLEKVLELNPDHFDERWKAAIRINNSDPSSSAKHLFSSSLLKSRPYREFLKELANHEPLSTKHSLLEYMIQSGLHHEALSVISGMNDISELKRLIHDKLDYGAKFENSFGRFTGYDKCTKSTAHIFSKLDIDLPGDYNGHYDSGKISNKEFDVKVDYISSVIETSGCGVPTAVVGSGNKLSIINSALLISFKYEHDRIDTLNLGKWHQEKFPKYCPVIADSSLENILIQNGCVGLEPLYESCGEITHSFSDVSGRIDSGQIKMSMAMLPYDVCAELRENKNKKIFMVPCNSKISYEKSTVPNELIVAMRFYRPQILLEKSYEHNSMVSTRLYLRGCNPGFQHLELNPFLQISEDERFVRAMSSDEEISELKKFYTIDERSHDRTRKVRFIQNEKLSVKDNVDALERNLRSLISLMKFNPPILFVGSTEFMKEASKRGLPISRHNECRLPNNKIDMNEMRLYSKLGYAPALKGLNTDDKKDLLMKAVRSNEESLVEQICGVLDRMPLMDVVNLASTPRQVEFISNHFDLEPILNDLPKPFQRIVTVKMLEEGLGL